MFVGLLAHRRRDGREPGYGLETRFHYCAESPPSERIRPVHHTRGAPRRRTLRQDTEDRLKKGSTTPSTQEWFTARQWQLRRNIPGTASLALRRAHVGIHSADSQTVPARCKCSSEQLATSATAEQFGIQRALRKQLARSINRTIWAAA